MTRPGREDGDGQATPPADDPAGRPGRVTLALDEVEARLAEGDLRAARRALTATRSLVGDEERGRTEALAERLGLLERLEGPTAAFEAAIASGDALGARDAAERAAEVAAGAEAATWRERHDAAAAQVRAEWCLSDHEVDVALDEPPLAACAAMLEPTAADVRTNLIEDGATLVLVAAFERWVFVYEIDLARRRLRRIGWLRAPAPLDHADVQVHEETIYLIGESGYLLELARRPLGVMRWRSLRSFMLPDRTVSDAFVVPPGRYLWAQLKEPFEEGGLAIVDLDEWRVSGRVHDFGSVTPVAGAQPARMLAVTLDQQAGLHDERGKTVAEPRVGAYRVLQLVAHPEGEGLLALVADDGPPDSPGDGHGEGDDRRDEEPGLALVTLRSGQPPSHPLRLADTNWEQRADLVVSLAERRAFLLATLEGREVLLAYCAGADGLVEEWRTEVPYPTVLARDAASRHVVALAPGAQGLEVASLGATAPRLAGGAGEGLDLGVDAPPFTLCAFGQGDRAAVLLKVEADQQRRAGRLERWAEVQRKARRGDPHALGDLADALLGSADQPYVERLLAFGLERHPSHPRFLLGRADLAARQGRWDEVARIVDAVDADALPEARACHAYHLRGLARLHAGDLTAAREHWRAGARRSPTRCGAAWHLELLGALQGPVEPDDPQAPALRRVVHACRRADAHLAWGDAAAAREALELPVVHAHLELQSAARLAAAHLALTPATPLATLAKTLALARLTALAGERRSAFNEIEGLGRTAGEVDGIAARARAWLDGLAGPAAPAQPSASPTPQRPAAAAPGGAPGGTAAREPHGLPPLGHEALARIVPGLEAAVKETVRYVRGQPGWDDTETLADDLLELQPVRRFLSAHLDRLEQRGVDPADADANVAELGRHLDYYLNFELHRRKAFFVDAPLAWLLARTSLDIEGRALRLPFSCFGVVFTDRATLEVAEALLREEGGALAGARLRILTVYVTRRPAPRGTHALGLSLVLDACEGLWPRLLVRELRFGEDDDLAATFDRRDDDLQSQLRLQRGEVRALLHLIVNAILYANSADVPWPIAPSPVRALRAQAHGRGGAKQARVARRAEELRKEYSDEDVFFLPGRIPISQLRALQEVEHGPQGPEILARFMVRGHWRRAARGWRDQRVRWIEPYWKGPELGPIMEKEYKLKI